MTIRRYSLQRYKHGAEEEYVLYADHVAEVCKLRDRLLAVAAACERCEGTGIWNELKDPAWPYLGYRQVPCTECEDIRSCLE